MKQAHSDNGTMCQKKRLPPRFRLKFDFWLDVTRPDQLEIAETIEELKAARTFSQIIRDGIRLVHSLRAGRVDVLEMLFPWIGDYYRNQQPSAADEFLRLIQRAGRSAMPLDMPDVSIFATDGEPAVTASEARATFSGGMGNLFDDDDDDLFD